MKTSFRFIATLLVQLCIVINAKAVVLATGQLITPLMPDMKKHLSISVPSVDPTKPVWVSYQLVGVSAAAKPEGEIVLSSSFEMIPVPMGDSFVTFKARNLKVDKSAGTVGNQLKALAGERKPEELKEIFGEEMYAAYVALNKQEGVYVSGNIYREYDIAGNTGLLLLTGIERATDIQPVLINVVVGQGEVPAQYRGADNLLAEKFLTALIAFAIAAYWLNRRRKS